MNDIDLIDLAENLAARMSLYFDRINDNEIALQMKGKTSVYNVAVILKPEYEIAYFSCDLDLLVTDESYLAIVESIVKVNEKIWVGHFDYIASERRIVYSLTIPFISSFGLDEDIVTATFRLITDECDRFYPYFSMIIEHGVVPEFSLCSLFLDAVGEA